MEISSLFHMRFFIVLHKNKTESIGSFMKTVSCGGGFFSFISLWIVSNLSSINPSVYCLTSKTTTWRHKIYSKHHFLWCRAYKIWLACMQRRLLCCFVLFVITVMNDIPKKKTVVEGNEWREVKRKWEHTRDFVFLFN